VRTPREYGKALPDGYIEVRTTIPNTLWTLVATWAQRQRVRPIDGFRMLMTQLADRIEAGDHAFLGPMFQKDIHNLTVSETIRPGGIPPVDEKLYGKFHRNEKVKSGYVGVYANGKGFRAVGRVPGGWNLTEKYIGTFPTADLAAQARYNYYKANTLLYGLAEETVIRLHETTIPDYTEYEALDFYNELQKTLNMPEIFPDDDYQTQLEKRNTPIKALGLDVPVPGMRSNKFGITEGRRMGERVPDPFGLEKKAAEEAKKAEAEADDDTNDEEP